MEFSNEIIKILDDLCRRIGVTIDWSKENIVPYVSVLCEKYIRWEIASSTMYIFLNCLIMLVVIIATCKVYKTKWIDDDIKVAAIVACVIVSFISVGFAIQEIPDIIKCLTFPEMKIYEYITELANK